MLQTNGSGDLTWVTQSGGSGSSQLSGGTVYSSAPTTSTSGSVGDTRLTKVQDEYDSSYYDYSLYVLFETSVTSGVTSYMWKSVSFFS